MDTRALAARAPIGALKDVESFLTVAEHLKALVLQLSERRARESRYQRSLQQQINLFASECRTLVHENPRLREMWTQTLSELTPLLDTGELQ